MLFDRCQICGRAASTAQFIAHCRTCGRLVCDRCRLGSACEVCREQAEPVGEFDAGLFDTKGQ